MAGSSALTITVDASQAIAALGAISGPAMQAKLGTALREAALFGERAVAEKTPVKTGVLRASVKAAQAGPLSWRIASPVVYAPMVEAGTRAHVIRPKRVKVLAFAVGGTKIFTRQVHHPGSKGARMFAQGAEALRSALPGILQKHVRPGT
jgi:hypothetical protein